MKNPLRSLAIAALVGCAASIALAAPADPRSAPPAPVKVTNTADEPVPVTVTNAAANPVPVIQQENPNQSLYVERAGVAITPPFVNNFIQFPTPPGRRYFIEQASVSCATPSNTDVFTQALLVVTKVVDPSGIDVIQVPVVVEKRGPTLFGTFVWTGTANLKVFTDANPNTPDGSGALLFNIFHTDATVTANCSASLFGYSLAL